MTRGLTQQAASNELAGAVPGAPGEHGERSLRRVALEALDTALLGRLRKLPEAQVTRIQQSLASRGQLAPVVAAEQDKQLILIDGFVRVLAARRLGLGSLWVEVVHLSPVEMKAQMYLRNQDRGLTLWEECRLLLDLCDVDGLNQVEIADLLEHHKSWACRRLRIARSLSPSLWEAPEVCRLGEGTISRLAQLQRRNQEELFAVIQREQLEASASRRLLDLYRRASAPGARRYLLEHPQEALAQAKGCAEPELDARLGRYAQELCNALERLHQASGAIRRRLAIGVGTVPPEGIERISEAHRRAQSEGKASLDEVCRWLWERRPHGETQVEEAAKVQGPLGA